MVDWALHKEGPSQIYNHGEGNGKQLDCLCKVMIFYTESCGAP